MTAWTSGLRFLLVESREGEPAAVRAAGVDLLDDAKVGVVILRPQPGVALPLPFAKDPLGYDRGQVTGPGLDQAAVRALDFLTRDGDVRILRARQAQGVFERVGRALSETRRRPGDH